MVLEVRGITLWSSDAMGCELWERRGSNQQRSPKIALYMEKTKEREKCWWEKVERERQMTDFNRRRKQFGNGEIRNVRRGRRQTCKRVIYNNNRCNSGIVIALFVTSFILNTLWRKCRFSCRWVFFLFRGRKVLENRSVTDEDRIFNLQRELESVVLQGEETDRKFEEVSFLLHAAAY